MLTRESQSHFPTPNPKDKTNIIILAFDLDKFNTMCCVFNTKTRKHEFINAATERSYLTTLFKKIECDLVVMEACGPCGWINDLAISLGHKTLFCSTNEDAWKWSNVKRKTDKDDALKLARMAAMGELKPVHMPSAQHREFRSLVKYRKTLDSRITKMKCTIRAWFVNQGISIDSGEKAWNTGRVHINSFRKPLAECSPNELWKAELDIELTQLDTLATHLELITKKLESIGRNDPRIQRVMSIPGVGPRTAEIIVACIDDPHRFQNGRQVSAYFGLVPRQNLRRGHHALPMEVEVAARRPLCPPVLEIKNLDGLRLDIHPGLEKVQPLIDPHQPLVPVEILEGGNSLDRLAVDETDSSTIHSRERLGRA